MASLKWTGPIQTAFLLAPTADPHYQAEVPTDLHPVKTTKCRHRKLNSEGAVPKSNCNGRITATKQMGRRKEHVRSTSPKVPFSDLSRMLDVLSRKIARKNQKWSPYSSPKQRTSLHHSPKTQKSLKQLQRPRCSLAPASSHIQLKCQDGTFVSPKIYKLQIFRDVFDQTTGKHERILYSSSEDSALEVYQANGEVLQPHLKKCKDEPKAVFESGRDLETEAEKEVLGEELIEKLRGLKDRSESDTACEECRDSRK